jgi:ketosteroid isomerase-like protein
LIDEETAKQTARQVFERFNQGDIAGVAALFHPDIRGEWPFPPPGGVSICEGKAEVLAMFENARDIIAEIKVTMNSLHWVPADGLVIIEGTGKARLVHGSAYDNRYVFVIAFRDGLVSLWREYFNPLIVQASLAAEEALA